MAAQIRDRHHRARFSCLSGAAPSYNLVQTGVYKQSYARHRYLRGNLSTEHLLLSREEKALIELLAIERDRTVRVNVSVPKTINERDLKGYALTLLGLNDERCRTMIVVGLGADFRENGAQPQLQGQKIMISGEIAESAIGNAVEQIIEPRSALGDVALRDSLS